MKFKLGGVELGVGNLVSGLTSTFAPSIFKGMMTEYIVLIDIRELTSYINKNVSLWDLIPKEHQEQILAYAPRVDDWSFLTVDWLIESFTEEHPALASLFLGWRKGRNWLERQIQEIKQKAEV
jgi:hypothetical protein